MLPKRNDYFILIVFFSTLIFFLYFSPQIDHTDAYFRESPQNISHIPSWLHSFSVENRKEFPTFHISFVSQEKIQRVDSENYDIIKVPFKKKLFQCNIPTLQNLIEQNSKAKSSLIPVEASQKIDQGISRVQSIVASTLKKYPCALYTSTYWRYLICFEKDIKQFHEANLDGEIFRIENSLGSHFTDTWTNIKSPDMFQLDSENKNQDDSLDLQFQSKSSEISLESTSKTPFIFSQEFDNGDICDLTRKPRKTTIKWVCPSRFTNSYENTKNSPSLVQSMDIFTKFETSETQGSPHLKHIDDSRDSNPPPLILSVSEVSTCKYEIQAFIPAICEYPTILSMNDPPHISSNHSVFCSEFEQPSTYQRIPNLRKSINTAWLQFFEDFPKE